MTSANEKVVAFIVARLSSSRLPAKQLRTIGGSPLLKWTLAGLSHAKSIDSIVLATFAGDENLPLKDFAAANNMNIFWYEGEPNHVTTRLHEAALHFSADICILVSGDCPLMDGEAIDTLVDQLKANPSADYISTPKGIDGSHCMLQGVQVARLKCWQEAEKLSNKPELKEHHFPVLYIKPEYFNQQECQLESSLYSSFHRLSIDTYADLHFFNKLYDKLVAEGKDFTLKNAIHLLERHGHLKELNAHVYQRKVVELIPKIFFLSTQSAEAKDKLNSIYVETILYITESTGWPILYLTEHQGELSLLEDRGIRYKHFSQTGELSKILSQEEPVHMILGCNNKSATSDMMQILVDTCDSVTLLHNPSETTDDPDKLFTIQADTLENNLRKGCEDIIHHINLFMGKSISA